MILDYLSQPFEELNSVPKNKLDSVLIRVKEFFINNSRDENELNQLIGLTSYYYSIVSNKEAQAKNIKMMHDVRIKRYKEKLRKSRTELKKTELESLCYGDEGFTDLLEKKILAENVELYLTNTKNSLYLFHYSLRQKVDKLHNHKINEQQYAPQRF